MPAGHAGILGSALSDWISSTAAAYTTPTPELVAGDATQKPAWILALR